MDAIMNKIERLAAMARSQSVPVPLDCDSVMARIRGLEVEEEGVLSLPLRFYAGGAAMAAVAAVAVTLLAATAWTEMTGPLAALDSLAEVSLEMMDLL